MDFLDSTSHALQLILALVGGVVLFMLAAVGYARTMFIALVVMMPFQPIDSIYGSINMAVTYVLAMAVLLNSFRYRSTQNTVAPLILPFGFLVLAYLISWSFAPTLFSSKYFFQMIQFGSNVALFYISYAFFKIEKDLDTFFKALIFSNLLVVIYSIVQVIVGSGNLSVFGVQELSFLANREDQRLVGPFQAVGITAEYLVIQSLILAHYITQTGRLRVMGPVLLLGNIAVLVGTGNRGGFLSGLLAVLLFLHFYRGYLGGKRVFLAGFGILFLLFTASFLMIKYTNYNVLYTRLLGTEMHGVTPDSRVGWSYVVEKILERPIIGHGPRIVMPDEYSSPPRSWPSGYITYYPHSLYLYILYTTGFFGLMAYAVWAANYWIMLCRERRRSRLFLGVGLGLSNLGMIVFAIFLIDQLKVEFLRFYLLDYQHYLAALFGMFAALGKIKTEDAFHIDRGNGI